MAALLITLAAINAPFFLLQKFFYVQQPIFNLDIGVSLALMSLNFNLGLALLLAVCVIDIIQAISLSYHFGDAVDFLATWYFAPLLNWDRFITSSLVILILLLGFATFGFGFILNKVRPRFAEVTATLVFFIFLDLANGSMNFRGLGGDNYIVHANIMGSPVWNAVNRKVLGFQSEAKPIQSLSEARVYERLKGWLEQSGGGSALLLLVESFGRFEDPTIRKLLDDALLIPEISEYWNVEILDEMFSGSTTYGELRTLCGVAGHYSRLTPLEGMSCIPSLAKAMGYETVGLHGFTSRMFDRDQWWPSVGLSRSMFSHDFPNASICEGAFTGICDADVIHKAIDLTQKKNQFIYALTLNTHLPLNDVKVPSAVKNICLQRNLADRSCNMLSALIHLLSATAQDIASRPKRPLVIITGDHSPPFNWIDERSAFSSARVPVYVLTPKRF